MRVNTGFSNPLVERYAGKEMLLNFSPLRRYQLWRALWVALAEAEKKLGLRREHRLQPRVPGQYLLDLRPLEEISGFRLPPHDHVDERLRPTQVHVAMVVDQERGPRDIE